MKSRIILLLVNKILYGRGIFCHRDVNVSGAHLKWGVKAMMKKLWPFLLIALLVACSNDRVTESADITIIKMPPTVNVANLEAEKWLQDVEIQVPVQFVSVQERYNVQNDMHEKDVKSAALNDDGSITYRMTKASYDQKLIKMKSEVEAILANLIESDEFPNVQHITYDESFSKFEITVLRDKYESGFESFAVFNVIVKAVYYQMFKDASSVSEVEIHFIDANNDETYSIRKFPSDFAVIEDI